ncbi:MULTISPECIES: type II secretion system F family protein [unclassified Arthrobacter]|uniref:type II secretion system F family protein n=1 Tax=unclassified Arthrobacter TaxID=235627 RepID=UPI001E4A8CCF|nr:MULTISPECIES: type II secretion system F family protein [unclassified Arthrobacter]MCC9146476.1 type II secretion system F family protein [Arthrobacter sp. zg-Y919]MDK1277706.1 type II secretion system F family protein [Arthrobacter sp. zg.Y919]WIB02336.1 type II secretion system F family protein [Arthrobacter sp. zg-Y919]
MNAPWFPAIVCGLVLGSSLWLAVLRVPLLRQIRFSERIAPQLRAGGQGSRLLATTAGDLTPFGPLERILRPALHLAVLRLNRLNPASRDLEQRLERAGRGLRIMDFRAEQVLWTGTGFLAGGLVTVWLAGSGRVGAVGVIAGTLLGAVLGFVLRDYRLGAQIRAREARMLAEFPSLAEMMALAVGAGESANGALERIARTAHGELAGEFARILGETRSGVPLSSALQHFSNRIRLAPLTRFVDGVSVAVDRGTPLADVMRAQAQDVRDTAKRELMETAGKKEIGMMVPVIFGILPLTVLFAVFPGMALLRLGL